MMLPEIFEMRYPTHHKDDIEFPLADHLICDVHIAVLHITCLG